MSLSRSALGDGNRNGNRHAVVSFVLGKSTFPYAHHKVRVVLVNVKIKLGKSGRICLIIDCH